MGNKYISRLLSSSNIRNGAIYTLFSFVNRGIGFILLLILAGYLKPGDYGYLNLFNTFVTLVGLLITLGTTGYVSVSFFQKSREDLNRIIGFSLSLTTTVLIVLSLLLVIFPMEIQRVVGIGYKYLWIAIFICYCTEITNLNLNLWQLEEKPISYGVATLIIAILNFCLTFYFIVGLKLNWEGRAYSQLLVSTGVGIYSVYFLIKRQYVAIRSINKVIVVETLAYGLPLVPHLMSFWFKQGCDRYVINYYWDSSYVGLYSFAINFASVISMIGTAFNASNSVYIFKNLAKGYGQSKAILSKINRAMTMIYLAIFICVAIGSSIFIPYFLNRYAGSVAYIFPVCFGAFWQCLYLLYVNYLFYYKRTKQLMYITFSTALLQFGISLIVTKYSVLYTAYSSMVISILTFVAVFLLVRKTTRNYNESI